MHHPAFSITRWLSRTDLEPEQLHVLEIAFRHAVQKVSLTDDHDPICAQIAFWMLESYGRGITSALALAEFAIREFGSLRENDL
jgi:hypothetical protein